MPADAALPGAVGKLLPSVPHWKATLVATWRPDDAVSLTAAGRYASRNWGTLDNSDPVGNTYGGFYKYLVVDLRAAIRADNSPIAYAYADPVLRASGLSGDTFGDARSFFELGTGEAHHLLCSCVNGRSVTGFATARRLRRLVACHTFTLLGHPWPSTSSR